jgi:hypothetical protein
MGLTQQGLIIDHCRVVTWRCSVRISVGMLASLIFLLVSTFPPGKYWYSTSITRRPFFASQCVCPLELCTLVTETVFKEPDCLCGAERYSRGRQLRGRLVSFPAFYGTRRFITASTRVLHLCISWTRPIQFTPHHPLSTRSTLMLSTHLLLVLLMVSFCFSYH